MERGNAAMNALAVKASGGRPDDRSPRDRVRPGRSAEIARLAPRGFAAGIDPSEAMIRRKFTQAQERIAAGRVELKLWVLHPASPYEDRRFDRVLTVNTIYFWGPDGSCPA
jgi:SAM-dependent methyltransferase